MSPWEGADLNPESCQLNSPSQEEVEEGLGLLTKDELHHSERNHLEVGNLILFPKSPTSRSVSGWHTQAQHHHHHILTHPQAFCIHQLLKSVRLLWISARSPLPLCLSHNECGASCGLMFPAPQLPQTWTESQVGAGKML